MLANSKTDMSALLSKLNTSLTNIHVSAGQVPEPVEELELPSMVDETPV